MRRVLLRRVLGWAGTSRGEIVVKARRAKARPVRAVVAIAVAVVVVVVGLVAAQQGWFSGSRSTTASPAVATSSGGPTSPPDPSVEASTSAGSSSDASPSTTGPSSTGSRPSPSGVKSSSAPDPSPSPEPAGSAAESALSSCRDRVRAADQVVEAATVGVRHWAEHVQAQTDANAGKISLAKMEAIFKRTRLDGPDDVNAYHSAQDKAGSRSGSCHAPDGASATVRDGMRTCSARSKAQQPVLQAADKAMDDWTSHLAAMRRSRMGHVHDAQGVWIRAWRAAPPHLSAFTEAQRRFDAASC